MVGIYHNLVYPFLIYAIPVWGVANDSIINPIKVLQKKIVRLITFTDTFPRPHGPLTHTIPIFYQIEILIVSDIFKLQTAKFVYNCVNLLAPNQFSNSTHLLTPIIIQQLQGRNYWKYHMLWLPTMD